MTYEVRTVAACCTNSPLKSALKTSGSIYQLCSYQSNSKVSPADMQGNSIKEHCFCKTDVLSAMTPRCLDAMHRELWVLNFLLATQVEGEGGRDDLSYRWQLLMDTSFSAVAAEVTRAGRRSMSSEPVFLRCQYFSVGDGVNLVHHSSGSTMPYR